jgi:CBS domain-containing membrane protein
MTTESIASTPEHARAQLRRWLVSFLPMPVAASYRERVLSCVGALLGLALTEAVSRWLLGASNPWFIAPMGASAVLLFAVPSSPLAQPWSVIGGNLIAGVIGVTCATFIPDPGYAAAIAVAVSIGIMFHLHCVHPPSGAVAATAVFGGPAVAKLGYAFVLFPVLLNSMLILLVALGFNYMARRRYPHHAVNKPSPHATHDPLPGQRLGVTPADIEAVLRARGEFLDIEQGNLEEILAAAQMRAYQRRFGEVRCEEIMSRDVISIEADSRLNDAWALFKRHRLQWLPVVSTRQRGMLVGAITLADFFVAGNGVPERRRGGIVRDVMFTEVPTARPEQPMIELAGLMSDGGVHQMPVVNDKRELLGLVTQSDLVAAMLRNQIRAAAQVEPA